MAWIRALLLLLLLWPGGAGAEPRWVAAPEASVEVPAIPAPPGGWWVEDGAYVRVSGASEDRATVRRLADHAARSLPALSTRLGIPSGGLLDVYVALPGTFQAIQPGAPPDWADGTAWPRQGLIFLHSPHDRPGDAEPLETVLDHEMVHVLVGRAFAPRPVPRWLQEGLAQVVAGELGPQVVDTITNARLYGGLIPIDTLVRGFPSDVLGARLAYAQSADFVAWLVAEAGEDGLRRLIQAMANGDTVESTLWEVTGRRLPELQAAWEDRWADPWLWVRAILNTEVLWVVGAALLVYGGYRRLRRGREKLARWEYEERRLRERQEALLRERMELDGYASPERRGQILEFRGPEQ